MNTKLKLAIVGFAAVFSVNAHAYTSGAVDPTTGEGEKDYRVVKKSETAGFSDAIAKGDIVKLDTINNNDGYTVTRVGANNVATTSLIVCIASKAIATGNTGLNRCVTRGYIDYLKYDASSGPIVVGQKLCMNAVGAAVPCAPCSVASPDENNCKFGNATENSPIRALSAVSSGTGTNLKAIIRAQ